MLKIGGGHVTCKIKHLQNISKNVLELSSSSGFKAVDFPRLRREYKNVVKMFYFTCNHRLSSTCVQRAKTFPKHLQKCFTAVDFLFYFKNKNFYFTCNHL